jgi:hypothetical protein
MGVRLGIEQARGRFVERMVTVALGRRERPLVESDKRDQLRNLARMREQGRISPEEYREHKALLIGDGDDLPDPDPTEIHRSRTPQLSAELERSYEESVVHLLREVNKEARQQTVLIRSVRAWVMFFGVLAVLGIVGRVILFLFAS